MIIDIAQLANGIEVSWVNEAGGIEISNYHVCDIPYQYPIWRVAEAQRPEYAGIKDYRNLPVERAYAKRFNQFDLLQFLQNLPDEDKHNLFTYRRPKLYFFDIETEIGEGFPKPDKAEMPINCISTCDEQANVIVQTTVDLLGDPDLKAKLGGRQPTMNDVYTFINEIVQNYMSQHCFKQLLRQSPIVKIVQHQNEYELLHFWTSNILKACPAISGWNIWGFDIPYIKNRAKLYGFDLGLGSPVGRTVYGNGCPMHKFVDDYMNLIDKYDYSIWIKENLRLDYIAHRLFNVGKLPYLCTLKELYMYHPCTFVAYNIVDTQVNSMIHARVDVFQNVLGLSQKTGIDMNHCQGPVKQSEGLIMNYWLEHYGGSIVVAEGGPEKIVREFEGGFVKQPFKHHSRHVACFDYSALYPSAMRTHNISPQNYIRRLVDPKEIEFYKADPKYFVSVTGGLYLNDQDYIYKIIQDKLGVDRNEEKKLQLWYLNNHVQLIEAELERRGALKI